MHQRVVEYGFQVYSLVIFGYIRIYFTCTYEWFHHFTYPTSIDSFGLPIIPAKVVENNAVNFILFIIMFIYITNE